MKNILTSTLLPIRDTPEVYTQYTVDSGNEYLHPASGRNGYTLTTALLTVEMNNPTET